MNIFETFSPESKIWIYQCSREFTNDEVTEIAQKGEVFISRWHAHESRLEAAMEIVYNRFIIFAVDEDHAQASGCSIDKSVAFIKETEAFYNVSLLDRMQVAFKNNGIITTSPLSEFEKLLKSGLLNDNTIVFNNLVATKKEFDNNWEVPLKNSWHSRLIES